MIIVYILAAIGFGTVWAAPIIWHWCIKPNKSIQDGLRDWIEESADDI